MGLIGLDFFLWMFCDNCQAKTTENREGAAGDGQF